MCIHGFDGGWPSLFYVLGAAGIVWFIFSLLLNSSTPDSHKFIGTNEKEYILTKINGSLDKQEKLVS